MKPALPGGRFLQPPSTVPQQPSGDGGALPAADGALAIVACMQPIGGAAPGSVPVAFSVASGAASVLISDPRLLDALRRGCPVVLSFERLDDALVVENHIERCRRALTQ
jgi:hypothetical protein